MQKTHGIAFFLLLTTALQSLVAEEQGIPEFAESDNFITGAFSPDTKLFATHDRAHEDVVVVYAIDARKLHRTLAGHTNSVGAVAFSPDGKLIASNSNDGSVKIWDSASGQLKSSFEKRGGGSCIGFSADGKRIGSVRNGLELWDVASGDTRAVLDLSEISCLAFSQDGKHAITGAYHRLAVLWDLATNKSKAELPHRSGVTSVALSHNGKLIATGSQLGEVALWDGATGEQVATFKEHEDEVSVLAFSQDDSALVSGGYDGKPMIRLPKKGSKGKALEAQNAGICALAFRPGQKTIALVTRRQTIRILDYSKLQPLE